MAHVYVRHDPCICVTSSRQSRLQDTISHTFVGHDSCICVAWLMHMWDMTRIYVWQARDDQDSRNYFCMHIYHMTHVHVWHDSSIRVTWRMPCARQARDDQCSKNHFRLVPITLRPLCRSIVGAFLYMYIRQRAYLYVCMHVGVCVCVCVCVCVWRVGVGVFCAKEPIPLIAWGTIFQVSLYIDVPTFFMPVCLYVCMHVGECVCLNVYVGFTYECVCVLYVYTHTRMHARKKIFILDARPRTQLKKSANNSIGSLFWTKPCLVGSRTHTHTHTHKYTLRRVEHANMSKTLVPFDVFDVTCHTHLTQRSSDRNWYGVATISRLLKIIGLFCRILSRSQGSFAKETCNFKEPTNSSHPIHDFSDSDNNSNHHHHAHTMHTAHYAKGRGGTRKTRRQILYLPFQTTGTRGAVP